MRLKKKTTGQYEHKHIAHWSLTLAPEDMRQPLSDAQWNWVAERFVKKMGLEGCRYVVVRHGDTVTGLGHAHIALNLVRLDGTRGSTVRDWPRAQQACAEIASDLGLAMPHRQSRHLNAEQRGRARIDEPGELGIRHQLRRRVDAALHESTDTEMLATALRQHGVHWHNTDRDGRKGLSFSIDERADIWIAGGEIDASRRQVSQRLKANAAQAQPEQLRQAHEMLEQIAQNDPGIAAALKARSLSDLANPSPRTAGPLTPPEAEPERMRPNLTRGPDPGVDNGPDR